MDYFTKVMKVGQYLLLTEEEMAQWLIDNDDVADHFSVERQADGQYVVTKLEEY